MKVHAVIDDGKKAKILTWGSKKEFMANEKWNDPKFTKVCTTSELIGYEYETEPCKMIVCSEAEKRAYPLLHEAYKQSKK